MPARKRHRLRNWLLPVLVLLSDPATAATVQVAGQAARQDACVPHLVHAARAHDVPVAILRAVGVVESGSGGVMSPNAVNVSGTSHFPKSAAAALNILAAAKARGETLVDLGCMQINYRYHRDRFSSDADMLDPEHNVMYAANFLKTLKKRHKSWEMAIARYHAGPDNDPAQKQYVCRVIGALVSQRLGAWTPQARAFCR